MGRANAAGWGGVGSGVGAVVVTVGLIGLIGELFALSILYQVLLMLACVWVLVSVGVTIGGCCSSSSSSMMACSCLSSSSMMMAANGFPTWTDVLRLVGGIGDVRELLGVHESSIQASSSIYGYW